LKKIDVCIYELQKLFQNGEVATEIWKCNNMFP